MAGWPWWPSWVRPPDFHTECACLRKRCVWSRAGKGCIHIRLSIRKYTMRSHVRPEACHARKSVRSRTAMHDV